MLCRLSGRLIIDALAGQSSAVAEPSFALGRDRADYQLWGPLSVELAGSGVVGVLELGHSPFRVPNVD